MQTPVLEKRTYFDYTVCVLREPITVQGWQGMEEVHFMEKTTAARAIGHELFIYMPVGHTALSGSESQPRSSRI